MNPCQFPQVTRPRSRSPSPNFRTRHAENEENISEFDHGQPCQSGSKLILGNDLHNDDRPPRSRSRLGNPQDNAGVQAGPFLTVPGDHPQDTNCSHASDPTVNDEASRHWRKRYRTQSGPSEGDRELLLRRQARRTPSMPMDEHGRRNYGSVNDELQPLVGNIERDGRGDSPSPVSFIRQKSYYTPAMVDGLRKRNQLYFLDPITKLIYFHGFPWKLTFQILKVILITVQIIIFGGQRESIVEYFEGSALTYRHLLLQDWNEAYETMPYPPASGPYAVYSFEKLREHLNYAVEQYYKLPEKSLATLRLYEDEEGIIKPVSICYEAYSSLEYKNGTYIVTGDINSNCIDLIPKGHPGNYTFDIIQFIHEKNISIIFNRTVSISLRMYIHTFHLNLVETHYGPSCYNVSLDIKYENTDRSGQLLVDLQTSPEEVSCSNHLSPQLNDEMEDRKTKAIILDVIVICLCGISTILCSRSLSRSNKLRKATSHYFKCHKGKPLSFSSQMEYINLWYIAIMCNDVLTIVGSALKIQLESRVFSMSSENYAMCSIFLGLGIFLSYMTILRYLSFFKSYNVLILTLKTSFPHVVRFLVCAVCLYTGFLFCGWIVFSPYHIKFRRLSTSSECLFSLVNGDDMFVTFSALTTNNNAIWYFHRCYLYIFIAIFIYVVLSVFIAVIMDNYENLKFYYEKGFPDTDIQRFIKEEGELQKSELFSHVKHGTKCQRCFFCLFPCFSCFRKWPKSLDQLEKILSEPL